MLHIRALKEYLNLCNKTSKCTFITHFYHILLITNMFQSHFAFIIRLDFKLPNCVSGNTQRYKRCLQLSIWSQNVSLYVIKNRWSLVVRNKLNWVYFCAQLIHNSTEWKVYISPSFNSTYRFYLFLTTKFFLFLIIGKLNFCDNMRVWDGYYNVERFHLYNLAVCCFISTLVSYPDDDRKSDRDMLVINSMW
jgi:hypothetical protein